MGQGDDWDMDTNINNVFEGVLGCPHLKGLVKVVGIWELILTEQTIKIKVTYNYMTKFYSYTVSHYYQGVTEDRPRIPREIIDNTAEGILKRAIRIILSAYDNNHIDGKWVINKEF